MYRFGKYLFLTCSFVLLVWITFVLLVGVIFVLLVWVIQFFLVKSFILWSKDFLHRFKCRWKGNTIFVVILTSEMRHSYYFLVCQNLWLKSCHWKPMIESRINLQVSKKSIFSAPRSAIGVTNRAFCPSNARGASTHRPQWAEWWQLRWRQRSRREVCKRICRSDGC